MRARAGDKKQPSHREICRVRTADTPFFERSAPSVLLQASFRGMNRLPFRFFTATQPRAPCMDSEAECNDDPNNRLRDISAHPGSRTSRGRGLIELVAGIVEVRDSLAAQIVFLAEPPMLFSDAPMHTMRILRLRSAYVVSNLKRRHLPAITNLYDIFVHITHACYRAVFRADRSSRDARRSRCLPRILRKDLLFGQTTARFAFSDESGFESGETCLS
jgi:hypothetical protein